MCWQEVAHRSKPCWRTEIKKNFVDSYSCFNVEGFLSRTRVLSQPNAAEARRIPRCMLSVKSRVLLRTEPKGVNCFSLLVAEHQRGKNTVHWSGHMNVRGFLSFCCQQVGQYVCMHLTCDPTVFHQLHNPRLDIASELITLQSRYQFI